MRLIQHLRTCNSNVKVVLLETFTVWAILNTVNIICVILLIYVKITVQVQTIL